MGEREERGGGGKGEVGGGRSDLFSVVRYYSSFS